MTGEQLRREAQAHGVATSYRDWRGQRAEVGEDTLRAVLAALGEATPRQAPRPLRAHLGQPRAAPSGRPELGVHRPAVLAAVPPVMGPRRPARPGRPCRLERARARRGLRARQPAARGRAGPAGEPVAVPADDQAVHQPALPAGRGRPRVRAAARRAAAPRSRAWPPRCAPPALAGGLIDRDAVWRAKRAALEIIGSSRWPRAAAPRSSGSASDEGQPLERLGDLVRAGGDARTRLAELATPLRSIRSAAVARRSAARCGPGRGSTPGCSGIASEQLAAAQAAARAAGMRIGVIADLAVGVHPGGADAWAYADVLVRGSAWARHPTRSTSSARTGAASVASRPARRGRLPAAGRPDARRASATSAGCGSTT